MIKINTYKRQDGRYESRVYYKNSGNKKRK